MIRVVHCKGSEPYDIYIGRANRDLPESRWANPFKIGKDGTREQVVAKYEAWLPTQPDLMENLSELRDKTLGCWCHEGQKCHGHVLARFAEPLRGWSTHAIIIDDPLDVPSLPIPVIKTDVIPCFTSMYSYNQSILSLEEAGKTRAGNPVSIVDLAREHHLKQVVLVDERMDGVLEAFKNLDKPFKPTPPKTLADYLKEEQGDKKAASEEDALVAQASLDEATAKYEREKQWSTEPIQLIFGLKLTIVPDMTVKTPEADVNKSSVIVFMKDSVKPTGISPSYTDLLKLNNLAWTTGRAAQGRLDWAALKRLWTPNLVLALPYFSSFIARNLLTMASIVPDLPCTPTLFREVDSELPFAELIDEAIERYVASNPAPIQRVKSIYYRDSAAFEDYTLFRARSTRSKGKSGTLSAPGVDNLCSDRFSFQAWRELT